MSRCGLFLLSGGLFMNTYLEKAKERKVYGEYDVVIIGGGCAGFAAAVAAGRLGVKTLIIEQFPFFGGTATASLMADIVGIRNQVEPNDLQVMKGIGEELILRMLKKAVRISPSTKATRPSNAATRKEISPTVMRSTPNASKQKH